MVVILFLFTISIEHLSLFMIDRTITKLLRKIFNFNYIKVLVEYFWSKHAINRPKISHLNYWENVGLLVTLMNKYQRMIFLAKFSWKCNKFRWADISIIECLLGIKKVQRFWLCLNKKWGNKWDKNFNLYVMKLLISLLREMKPLMISWKIIIGWEAWNMLNKLVKVIFNRCIFIPIIVRIDY